MKRILRVFAVETISVYLISQIASGLVFEKGIESLVIAGIFLTAATFLVRPIINLLLLPLNIMTFGLLKWLSHAITLYLVDLAIPTFGVMAFNFSGANLGPLNLPPITFTQGMFTYIAYAFILSFLTTILYWLVD